MSKQSSRGRDWDALRTYVLERDNYVCAYGCGRPADTVDHITPKAAGGVDEDWNLVASCRRCNGIKSDRVMVRTNYINKRWLTSV